MGRRAWGRGTRTGSYVAVATGVEDLGGDGMERSFASRPCGEEKLKVGGDEVHEEGWARRRQTHWRRLLSSGTLGRVVRSHVEAGR